MDSKILMACAEVAYNYSKMIEVKTSASKKKYYQEIIKLADKTPEIEHYYFIDRQRHCNRPYNDSIIIIKDYLTGEEKISLKELNHIRQNHTPCFLTESYLSRCKESICAYIVYLEDCDLIKVGMSNNFPRRKKELIAKYGELDVIEIFPFNNVEDAYLMEVILHKFFKEKYPNGTYIPQDRFQNVDLTQIEIYKLREIAEELRNKKWF